MITGFPSPAQGYEDNKLDLNSLYIKHPAATVFMTVDTNRYSSSCIFKGDLLIIDRARRINPNSLVVYESQGQFVIGRAYGIKDEALITGAITHVIHTVREK
ncbi:MAG: hypothetical protein K5930_05220 [Treponemataceae bacterium]|nr:hypothetical protein [Treponemataceae bacterium]